LARTLGTNEIRQEHRN